MAGTRLDEPARPGPFGPAPVPGDLPASPASTWSGWLHAAGALAAAVAAISLWRASAGDRPRQLSMAVYGVSQVLLYAASTAYHLLRAGGRHRPWLRRLDHSSAFLLIAGTYTPVLYNALDATWRWGCLAAIWGLSAAGMALGLQVTMRTPRWARAGLYVLVGWFAVVPLPRLAARLPPAAIAVMVAGGLAYTTGAVIYAARRPDPWPGRFGFHEIWHLFVLAGGGLFFVLIYGWI